MQARSGAQALQIFESWAEGLAEDVFERLVIAAAPGHRRAGLRAPGVTAPFIGFPRGRRRAGRELRRAPCRCEGVALDTQASAGARPAAAGRRQDHPGRARQPAAARRRPGAGRAGRAAARAVGRRALHLQPRPRRHARHADRAHRPRRGAGDRQAGEGHGGGVTRLAVVLFNLGGPDSPKAVRPFLFNLFRDPAIITLPAVGALPLAALISTTREKAAQANYALWAAPRRCCRRPRPRPRRWRRRWPQRMPDDEVAAASSPCATGGRSPSETAARGRGLRAGRDRAAAALSAVFDHHHRLVAEGLARGLPGPGRSARGLLLSDRATAWSRPTPRRSARPGQAAGQPTGVRLLFSAHGLPRADRRRRRSLPGADRGHAPRRSRRGCRSLRTGGSATRAGSGR